MFRPEVYHPVCDDPRLRGAALRRLTRVLALFCPFVVASESLEMCAAEYPTIGRIERLDPALDAIVDPDAKIEILAEGFDWSEGPIWSQQLQSILFCDIPRNRVNRWNAKEGLTVFLEPAGYTGSATRGGETGSNGLTLDSQGRLVLCQHGDRCIARLDAPLAQPKPKYVRLAESYDGKRFNSPNDLVYHSSGTLYFTDPPYGLEKQADDPLREMDFCGVYRLGTDGKVRPDDRRSSFAPTGWRFRPMKRRCTSPNRTPQRPIWMAYPMNDDCRWATDASSSTRPNLAKTQRGLPDGLKIDRRGNLLATGPGGVLVITPDGQAPGHHRHRREHCQLCLWRRR